MLLNIVSDNELLISQIVKIVLMLILASGIIYNFFRILKAVSIKKKIFSSALFILLSLIFFFVLKVFRIEASLLNKPEYTEGTTIGFCNVFAKGQGIEFEYVINGVKYRCCNTFYPVPKDSILVPGGKYKVRYSEEFKTEGRMIFKKE